MVCERCTLMMPVHRVFSHRDGRNFENGLLLLIRTEEHGRSGIRSVQGHSGFTYVSLDDNGSIRRNFQIDGDAFCDFTRLSGYILEQLVFAPSLMKVSPIFDPPGTGQMSRLRTR